MIARRSASALLCPRTIACFIVLAAGLVAGGFAVGEAVGGENAEDVSATDAARVPEPDGFRMDEYRKPVPATLKGATILSSDAAHELWQSGKAVFIDVYPHAPKPTNLPAGTLWREPQHFSIENAVWLANVGFGKLAPETETYFKGHLSRLSGGDTGKPLVFFCLRDCWMSWNAAKRALDYGYTNVLWFPDGTDGWQEIGQLVVEVKPVE